MTFEEFLAGSVRSAWIQEPGIELYVRKSIHKNVDIDLANMSADAPGKGALTRFLNKYESKYIFRVESILNERLVAYLQRRGYVRQQTWNDLQINMVNRV